MTDTTPDLDAMRDAFARILERNEYYDWLGVEPVEVAQGRAVGELTFEERLTTPGTFGMETLHGGVLVTLMDVTAVGAVLTTRDVRTTVLTADLSVEFHEPARESVHAVAEVTGDRGSEVHVSVSVESVPDDGASTTVATGEVVCTVS